MNVLKRAWPLLAIAIALAVAFSLGLQRQLSWAAIASHQAALRDLVATHPVLAAAGYVGVYMAAVAVSIPGGVWLTIAGGLLFGTALGGALAVLGAGCGAVLLFLAARSALGGFLAERAGPLLARVRPGLERDGFSYLLALRLIPAVPFWLANLAPALVGMKLAPYAAATFIGIIPATLVFASVGAGLANVLGTGATPNLMVILSPEILLPLLGLALLSLLPVGWRRWKASRAGLWRA